MKLNRRPSRNGALLGKSRALSYGFELGDLVWGKVKSHPWWPGHIFNEALASSSVCRTRREGYVLVAFFGDSSYGWFDPAELVPFDSNFSEKLQQITSRTFVKAVEEAMDETNRRCGLGLTCKCRNPYNFRPTNVEGYFAVDVPDFEPNGVYSANQIKKARDRFKPSETLSFIKQLSLSPQNIEQKSIEFIEKKATVFAYRKAVFEEYDETYAQAFGSGAKSVRPAQDHAHLKNQASKKGSRAPLSGPLVIAETLSGGKSGKKPMKVKDHSKKDKYLFKRRDESTRDIKPEQPSSSALMEESTAVESAGEYVLQKRPPVVIAHDKNEQVEIVSSDVAGPPVNVSSDLSLQGDDKKPSRDMLETKDEIQSHVPVTTDSTSTPLQLEGNAMIDVKIPFDQSNSNLAKGEGGDQIQEGQPKPLLKRPSGISTDGKAKKLKAPKRKSTELSSENSDTVEKKKRRKKKDLASETSFNQGKRMAEKGEPREGSLMTQQKSTTTVTLQTDLELPVVLSDLQALALDPFHGAEKDSPAIVRQFFLGFRALVYQKSLLLSPPSESDQVEVRAAKPEKKPLVKPDKPIKSRRRPLISEHQEENAAKRLKKIPKLKSLAVEKKSITQKAVQASRPEVKDHVASTTPSKPVKHSVKKNVVPARAAIQPTMLIMKFPPDTSLPSAPELKAKFGRFGSLDQSAIRVFWKSFTCRVVFRHKADADAAYRYAVGNKSLFGNIRVKYFLREVEASEPDKAREEDSMQLNDPPNNNRPARLHQHPASPAVQLKSCLKKPTGDDEGQTTVRGDNNGGGRTTRVRFALVGEETSNRNEAQMVGNRNYSEKQNGCFADDGGSSFAMEYNSKNFQNIVPISSNIFSSSSTILPLATPPQYLKTPVSNTLHIEVLPPPPPPPPPPSRNSDMNLNNASTPSSSVDIRQQMLTLLTRCNEVVSNVTGHLGYVPYHTL
ncbi:hypothetical protein ACFE04_026832 [Oxalis oulophora]